jgi:hypothetical protein
MFKPQVSLRSVMICRLNHLLRYLQKVKAMKVKPRCECFHAMVYSQLTVVLIDPAEPEGKTTGVEMQKQELRQKLRESTCQDHRHRARLYNQVLQLQLHLEAAKVKEFHSTTQIAALQEQMSESNKRAETLLRQERIAAELLREATSQILHHLMTTTSQLHHHLSEALLKCKQMRAKSREVVHRIVFELWRDKTAVEKQNTEQSAVATVATAQDAIRPAMYSGDCSYRTRCNLACNV